MSRIINAHQEIEISRISSLKRRYTNMIDGRAALQNERLNPPLISVAPTSFDISIEVRCCDAANIPFVGFGAPLPTKYLTLPSVRRRPSHFRFIFPTQKRSHAMLDGTLSRNITNHKIGAGALRFMSACGKVKHKQGRKIHVLLHAPVCSSVVFSTTCRRAGGQRHQHDSDGGSSLYLGVAPVPGATLANS